MAALDKPRLRNSLRKLRALADRLGGEADSGELGQEILDFLALQAGLKPVYLLGRGLDHPAWIAGVIALAAEFRLRVVEGPFWDATPFGDDMARRYVDDSRAEVAGFTARYLCRTAATERRVTEVCDAGGRLTASQEAALLGYPECCVVAHYRRALAYHRAVLSILERQGGGDPDRMRAYLRQGGRLTPETDAERAAFDEATTVIPAPFGSWNLCAGCAADDKSPSAALSRRYRELAEAIDRDWAAGLAAAVGAAPLRSLSRLV